MCICIFVVKSTLNHDIVCAHGKVVVVNHNCLFSFIFGKKAVAVLFVVDNITVYDLQRLPSN